MYFDYRAVSIEIYAGDCDEKNEIYYWAVFAGEYYLGSSFPSIEAALFEAIQYIELNRLIIEV